MLASRGTSDMLDAEATVAVVPACVIVPATILFTALTVTLN